MSFHCSSLPRTTALATFMATAVQCRMAYSRAAWWFNLTLMTDRLARCAAAATGDGDSLETWSTLSNMTALLAWMAAGQWLHTKLIAFGNRIFAGLSSCFRNIAECCVSTRTMRYQLWRSWALWGDFFLSMTGLLTPVYATGEQPITCAGALKHASPRFSNPLARV